MFKTVYSVVKVSEVKHCHFRLAHIAKLHQKTITLIRTGIGSAKTARETYLLFGAKLNIPRMALSGAEPAIILVPFIFR